MVFMKDGQTVELHDPAHIDAYRHHEWTELTESAEKPKKQPRKPAKRKGEQS